jgi:DNA-binding NarL/FixJ family response regulator
VSYRGGVAQSLAVSPWPKMRLVIAVSHARLRDAIAAALTSSDCVSVVGRVGDLAHAVQVTRKARPDGLVVGAGLLQGDCVGDLQGLVMANPGVRVFVIGTETSAAFGAAIKAAGAADYIALDSGTDSVVSAVRRAMPNDSADEA